MSGRAGVHSRSLQPLLLILVAGVVSAMLVRIAWAGLAGFRGSAVGGISISTDGVVGPPSDEARKMVLSELRRQVKGPTEGLNRSTPMRMISLRALNAACEEALKAGTGDIPDELRFLAGIQRIQYVFVYPEDHDIVLAGPGEGWKVDENANVVGVTTGRPVLRLDDLLVALRSVEQSRQGGITCSIDPTPEGMLALRNLLDKQRETQRNNSLNPSVLEAAIKREFGNQVVAISGVPSTSHFARVMVASDYRMKRLAMELERSPVAGLPSYVQLISKGGSRAVNNANPRWWLACHYDPLAASDDRLAWELRGPAVKALTEDEVMREEGRVEGTGKASPLAQKWADLLTAKYDEVSGKIPVFVDLRNLMDLCVIAALLEKEGLWDKAGLATPVLCDSRSPWKLEVWNAPKLVPPEVSFVKVSKAWIVTASGGVQLTPWQVASQVETSTQVADARKKATPTGTALWWQ